MNTLAEVKARFYDLQIEMANLFSLMSSEVANLNKKIEMAEVGVGKESGKTESGSKNAD